MKKLILSLFILLAIKGQGQDILRYNDFIQIVSDYHPMVQRAKLLLNRAEAQQMYTRGQNDPELNSQWNQKQFDGKNYFQVLDAQLRVPTIFGVEFQGGYQWANGTYLDESLTLPERGQAYLAIQVPLLQGLWNNERFVQLKQAKLLVNASKAELRSIINQVLSEAALNYLEWSYYVAQYQVLADAILRTEDQFKIIKNSYEQGDLPAIDTLKSFILLQDYQIQQNDLVLYLQKMRFQINNFLWTKDSLPLQMAETTNPQNLKEIFINTPDSNTLQFFLGILDQHPDLQNIQFQKDILDWERKFKNTKLLPKLDLKYNFLSTDQFQFFTPYGFQSFTENYKLGFKFQYPILIRKERADVILNQIKIKETNLKYQQKKYELENKYKSLFNELNILNKQSSQYNILTSNYATLAEAEKLKFSLGESDLLLVTTRDLQLLEAQLKLLKNSFKRSETLIKWLSSTAQFYQN